MVGFESSLLNFIWRSKWILLEPDVLFFWSQNRLYELFPNIRALVIFITMKIALQMLSSAAMTAFFGVD